MCVIEIPDDVMQEAGFANAHEAAIEVACRLYDAGKISLLAACRMAQLTRVELWDELTRRGLPWMRIGNDDYVEQELKAIRDLEQPK